MLLRTLASAGLLLAATAARADLQTYDVDIQIAQEVVGALNNALAQQCGILLVEQQRVANCSAQLLPSGQLLVQAPAPSQQQVAAVLKAVAAHRAAPAPRLTLRYWVVVGAPGAADNERLPLAPLKPVLQQLERTHGDLGFKIEGTVSVTSESGTKAEANGGPLGVSQRARAVGDNSLSADVELFLPAATQQLRVTVTITRGEYVVLGEQSNAEGAGSTFYIVNWPE